MAKSKTVTKQTVRTERAPGGAVPESVAIWFMQHPELFAEQQTFDRDTERLMKMSKRSIEKEDAEELAWLLWRARMTLNWSRNAERQPTIDWAQAIESAWLKDELFQMCNAKRKAFYEAREARRERLERSKLIYTGTKGVSLDPDHKRNDHEQMQDTEQAAEEQAAITADNAA
jgi:hypothetical protein